MRCVAVPIFGMSHPYVGAMSIFGPTTRLSPERAAELGPPRSLADEHAVQYPTWL